MRPQIIRVADDFWNIRGSFKLGGVVDIGTQASLIRRRNGRFVFLDSCGLSGDLKREILDLTGGGGGVEAILNLHPFHTVYSRKMQQAFPDARLYGTARHLARLPELPWEEQRCEDPELHAMFADDFDFSVPRGVDFISSNENVHFSSVLALHRASKTIHVDDTIMYIRLPGLIRALGLNDSMSFHPTLAKALETRPGATQDFRNWASELSSAWRDADNLCAAHTATLLASKNEGAAIHARLDKALQSVESKLTAHERKYG